ncbi:hypothetical protein [Nocardia farcinica]|nr:hypothetical protein [Nocardia farcinica]
MSTVAPVRLDVTASGVREINALLHGPDAPRRNGKNSPHVSRRRRRASRS